MPGNLTRAINHRYLYTRTQAGVQPQSWSRPSRCQQEQVFQVGCKHVNGFGFRGFTHLGHEISLDLRGQFYSPGPTHHL